MIKQLSIRNFKSVRQLDLSCRRVNVFIGEPNAGKTNVIEAIGLWCPAIADDFKTILRVDRVADVYFDQDPDNEIEVTCDTWRLMGDEGPSGGSLNLRYYAEGDPLVRPRVRIEIPDDPRNDNHFFADGSRDASFFAVHYYLFGRGYSEDDLEGKSLSSPYGNNMAELLTNSKSARQTASSFFSESRYRLTVDRARKAVMLAREEDGTLVALPYDSASETLRRMVFFHLAIDTNLNSTLVFDEPEAHSYPPYTKILAEKIALNDRGNQFFLTTHSPYMLDSLISKTPAEDLNIILCRMEDFETKAYVMTEEQKVQIMEWSMDAFFNFDRLLPERE